jgi:beta-glucanase (GH16 family)
VLKKEDHYFPISKDEIDTAKFKRQNIVLREPNLYPFKFTGGLLWSNRQFQYGYFEIKFKAPPGKGTWPAFWLYGAHPNNEIDWFELKGEKPKELHVEIHCPDGCSNFREFLTYRKGWGHWIKTDGILNESYSILSGEWRPDAIRWYLNGELIATSKNPFRLAMNLIVGTGIAKDGEPFKPGPDAKTPFPNYFDVDYVRVYRWDSLPDERQLISNFPETNQSIPLVADQFKIGRQTPEKYVTVSIQQLSHSEFSILLLGVRDSCKLVVKGKDGKTLQNFVTNRNSEFQFVIQDQEELIFVAKLMGREIRQRIKVY